MKATALRRHQVHRLGEDGEEYFRCTNWTKMAMLMGKLD